MTSTPIDPDPLYVLDWEEFEEGVPPGPPSGWRRDYTLEPSTAEPPYSIVSTPGPVRSGARSARFFLHRQDPLQSSGTRSELKTPCCEPPGAERWYGFSIYLPEDWLPDRSRENVAQWKQNDTEPLDPRHGGSPPAALTMEQGQWILTTRKSSWDNTIDQDVCVYALGACELDKWTDWVLHAKWSEGNEGFLEVWKNCQSVRILEGQNKFADGRGHYFKFGVYKWDWNVKDPKDPKYKATATDKRLLYLDEVRIADGRGSLEVISPPAT
ncbi:polysaccharide lyase [Modestobacter altitudinis]|uniref:polysaccharide lyase n=1 Tax=Modestobacter altitudinis TaxID=2213158 RepID=UPI001487556C|nr:polysaccharide lyase [Modestobacter altitudinis]